MSAPLRSPKLRELGDTARELGKLVEHPSWPVLRAEIEARKRAYLDKIAREIVAGGPDAEPVNQREADYIRGFFKGVQAVLDTPDAAVRQLEKALRKEQDG